MNFWERIVAARETAGLILEIDIIKARPAYNAERAFYIVFNNPLQILFQSKILDA